MSEKALSETTARIVPSLIFIQTHLDGDLSLERLAARAGFSPYHFHRLFRDVVGETLKQYTQRLRLERAAFELKIQDAPIVAIALASGYRSHETFSRAFRRHFGVTPRAYRQTSGRLLHEPAPQTASLALNELSSDSQISAVRIQKVTPLPLAFIRHRGNYLEVEVGLFDELVAWAQRRGVATGDNLLLGIGHDDPSITPVEKVRYDACIQVPGPFVPEGRIGFQWLPGGWHAALTYVGPYGPQLNAAYVAIVQHVAGRRQWQLVGLPAVEIYRTTRITPDYALNETDLYLPVEKAPRVG